MRHTTTPAEALALLPRAAGPALRTTSPPAPQHVGGHPCALYAALTGKPLPEAMPRPATPETAAEQTPARKPRKGAPFTLAMEIRE
jgi:hypothetical protein